MARGKRKDKKVSNDKWESPTDRDARITKMKDGRTHLAYKAEHTVDLDTGIIVAAEVYHANQSDQETIDASMESAEDNLIRGEVDATPKDGEKRPPSTRPAESPRWPVCQRAARYTGC